MKIHSIIHKPKNRSNKIPLLFVHGAWHGAWCWDENFLPYFASKGYEVQALDLRGHGESEGHEGIRFHRIMDYVKDVEEVVGDYDRPPILVGHSMGGLVVQKYLEKHSAPGAVLLAAVPPSGVLMTTLRIAGRHPWVLLKTIFTLSWYQVISTLELCKEAFFSSSIPESRLQKYFSKMQQESFLGFLDMTVFALPKPSKVQTPVLVLGGEKDMIFSPSQIEATAKAYGTESQIFPDMGHDMMLERDWKDVADRMLDWFSQFSFSNATASHSQKASPKRSAPAKKKGAPKKKSSGAKKKVSWKKAVKKKAAPKKKAAKKKRG